MLLSPIDEYLLDARAVRRGFDRASQTYARASGVQGEIRARLLERLDVVTLNPSRVLDLGAASGHSTRALKQRYPQSQIIAVDLSHPMLHEARREQSFFRRFHRVASDAHSLALKEGAFDLVFSNLMLAWCNHPDQVFREAARVLRPEGLFTFTTLGPDTLREVREAFRNVDDRVHVHRFIDMHDLGDALMRTGFAEPVMDTERLTVTFRSPLALLEELKATGSTNATVGRRRSLMGKAAFAELQRSVDRHRRGDVVQLTMEVVYGHAWRGRQKQSATSRGEVRIPLDSLRKRSV